MIVNQQKLPGVRWLFAATTVLAALTGYWHGHGRPDRVDESGSDAVSVRREQRSDIDVKAPPLTAVRLVRESIRGAVDGRQQWQHVRFFTEDEAKTAITELGGSGRNLDLEVMLYYRWGELDPAAANTAAKAMLPKGFAPQREAVIAAWIKQGGALAAWNAVKDESGMWDCTRSVRGEVAEMLVASLSGMNAMAAFKEVPRFDDENCELAVRLCIALAGKASGSPEARSAFLAAAAIHPDPYVLGCAYESLFRQWAKRDLDAARAGAATMAIPADLVENVRRSIDWVAREEGKPAEEPEAER